MKRRRRNRDARKSRAFYRKRKAGKTGGDVLPPDEAEALSAWRGCGVVLFAVVSTAVIGWIAAKLLFS